MKALLLAMGLLSFNIASAQTVLWGDIPNVARRDLPKVTKQYTKLVKEGFVSSNYCQEGWEGQEAEMQQACVVMQKKLEKELDLFDSWTYDFKLAQAEIKTEEVEYQFERILDMKNAPLSCVLFVDLKMKAGKLVSSSVDLYCDH